MISIGVLGLVVDLNMTIISLALYIYIYIFFVSIFYCNDKQILRKVSLKKHFYNFKKSLYTTLFLSICYTSLSLSVYPIPLLAAIEEEVTDEEMHEITEIVETYRVTEDGKTWKTVKKTTTITASGTSEKTEVLKGIPSH